MKTIYGIKQHYDLKDYVEYYSAIKSKDRTPCNEKFGYINRVEYECTLDGKIRLAYVIGDFVGSTSGSLVTEDRIIRKAIPDNTDYGYKEYLKYKITCNQSSIKSLEKEIKDLNKKLAEIK